jgi:hypothetical protein
MSTSFAVFHDRAHEDIVKSVKKYVDKNAQYYDFTVFSDNMNSFCGHAILSTFYMRFYKGNLVFTNLEDYLLYEKKITAKKRFVVTNIEELREYNITPKNLTNTTILQYVDGEINELR